MSEAPSPGDVGQRAQPRAQTGGSGGPGKRVLILSAGAGSGHNVEAGVLESHARTQPAVEAVQTLDVLELTSDIYRGLYDDAYFRLVNAVPWLVGWSYDARDTPFRKPDPLWLLDQLNTTEVARAIQSYQPDIVLSTHFLGGAKLSPGSRHRLSWHRTQVRAEEFSSDSTTVMWPPVLRTTPDSAKDSNVGGRTRPFIRNRPTVPGNNFAHDRCTATKYSSCLSSITAGSNGFAAAVGWNPADEGPGWRFFRLSPVPIQAYRGYAELQGREVMRDGSWLADR